MQSAGERGEVRDGGGGECTDGLCLNNTACDEEEVKERHDEDGVGDSLLQVLSESYWGRRGREGANAVKFEDFVLGNEALRTPESWGDTVRVQTAETAASAATWNHRNVTNKFKLF